MDKKVYVKPEIEVQGFVSDVLMQSASWALNEEGGEEQSLTNGRRGTWGDLWNEGE